MSGLSIAMVSAIGPLGRPAGRPISTAIGAIAARSRCALNTFVTSS
jgi:hypothetical protein